MRRLALGVSIVWLAGSCGTDAVGVSECREIEQARCAAAVSCGFADVDECQRFYRDHCLHGVAIDTVTQVDVDTCVAQIENAGRCAAAQPDLAPAACEVPIATQTEVAKVCDVVLTPELASACAFLRPTPAPAATPPAAGGAGGT
ncbi:MAG: hypothetical protein ABI895_37580 [Deltaproteobacteria bacterium]